MKEKIECNVWVILDTSKKKKRFCYADEKGSEAYSVGQVAVFFKKPLLKHLGVFKEFKKAAKAKLIVTL